jgi:two-component system, NarL family, response regulator NreC
MMQQKQRVLIVDDHPMMVDGYKTTLARTGISGSDIATARDCRSAYQLITGSPHPYDILLLDLNLPGYAEARLHSGEDIALLVRNLWPSSKIIMLTFHSEKFLLYNLVKSVNPEGILIKSDFTPTEFLAAFHQILNGERAYSPTARQGIRELANHETYLDATNRHIITLLSRGVATKNLPAHFNVTISAIDKRKAQIKDFLGIEKGSDEDIIREAKKRGFI